MENELSTQQTGKLVQTIDQQGVGDLLKPLIREIHLFDSYVAGTTHLEDKSVLEKIEVGDRLSLQREDNKFDENAILILTEDGKKLGYIPEKDNIIFARLLDAGKLLKAKISSVTQKGSFIQVGVGIYLVDL
jgi:hypothetical protein